VTISAEKLLAYVDGELDAREHAEMEAAISADAELRSRVERERKLRQRLSAAFDPTLDEPTPARLRTALGAPSSDNVLDFKPIRAWTYREWTAMAASLAGGLLIGWAMMSNQAGTLTPTGNGLAARGALAAALDGQLAGEVGGAVRIGISFRNRDGVYCRTFGLSRDQIAGLACKIDDQWRVPITAALASSGGEIRAAGSDTPAPVLSAVEAMIAGDPLDAQGEARAKSSHWRARR